MSIQIASADLMASLSYRAASAEQFVGFPRSLSLLKSIESTLDAIREEQDIVDKYAKVFMDKGDKLMASLGDEILDRDGAFYNVLLNAQKAIQKTHKEIKHWCAEATERGFDRLCGEIIEDVSRFTDSLSTLHNYLNALRITVATHDAKCSKVVGKFDSSEALQDFLRSA